jgi:hypothetical protein
MRSLHTLSVSLLSVLTLNSHSQHYALSFDGVGDYVDLGSNAGSGVRTIELWFKPGVQVDSTLPDLMPLLQRSPLGCGTCHSVSLTFLPTGSADAGKLSCGIRNEDGSVNNVVSSNSNMWHAGQWYHCACVAHPTDGMMLFIDGVKQTDVNPSGVNASTTDTNMTALGRWGSQNIRFYNGRIDDVRLSYAPRYNTHFTPPCPGDLSTDGSTIALWHFEEGVGVAGADSSGNAYHAALIGSTWAADTICLVSDVSASPDRFGLAFYPNPAGDFISIGGQPDDGLRFAILDVLGRQVSVGAVSEDMRIDISSLTPGYYTVVIDRRSAGLVVK